MSPVSQECPLCGKRTQLLCIKEVAFMLRACRRTVHYWINQGKVHGVKTPGGRTLICQSSLFQARHGTPAEPVGAGGSAQG